MKEYLKTQNKLNEVLLTNNASADEISRFSKSDYRWADNRARQLQQRKVKTGEVYQFEFGKNYTPEMSYEHRGLVIGVRKKMLYVLPVFSYNPNKHTDVYHPVNYPESKSDLFLLKKNEFSFLTHDLVLKLNDIRSISVNRILYQHKGTIPRSSNSYKLIMKLVFTKYFPEFAFTLAQTEEENLALRNTNEELQGENEKLKKDLENHEKLKKENDFPFYFFKNFFPERYGADFSPVFLVFIFSSSASQNSPPRIESYKINRSRYFTVILP